MQKLVAAALAVGSASAFSLPASHVSSGAQRRSPLMVAQQQNIGGPFVAIAIAGALAFGHDEAALAVDVPTSLLVADSREDQRAERDAAAAAKKAATVAKRQAAEEQKAIDSAMKKAREMAAKADAEQAAEEKAAAAAAAAAKAEAAAAPKAAPKAAAPKAAPKAAAPKAEAPKAAAPKAEAPKAAPKAAPAAKATGGKAYSAAKTDLTVGLKPGAIKVDPAEIIATRDINRIKLPQTIGVNVPVLGSLQVNLDVKVSKCSAEDVQASDVQIVLPSDLVKAGKQAIGGDAGVVLDAPGLVSTRLDLDIATPRKGEAAITVNSDLIPKLPLQKGDGKGRFCFDCGNGAPASDWVVSRNLGNGVSFYSNVKTGKSQFEPPPGF